MPVWRDLWNFQYRRDISPRFACDGRYRQGLRGVGQSSRKRGALRAPGAVGWGVRPIAVVAVLASGAAATPDLGSATSANTQLSATDAAIVPADAPTGDIPVMLQMADPAA